MGEVLKKKKEENEIILYRKQLMVFVVNMGICKEIWAW